MPEDDREKHLTRAPNRQLAATAIDSMVKRSLAQLPSLDAGRRVELLGVDWDHPVIAGMFVGYWLEDASSKHGAGAQWIILLCELTNVSDRSHNLGGELAAFCRSETGVVTTLPEAWLAEDRPDVGPLAGAFGVGPKETVRAQVEFLWNFSGNTPQEQTVSAIFGDSWELLLYDQTFKTVVWIPEDVPGDESPVTKGWREIRLKHPLVRE